MRAKCHHSHVWHQESGEDTDQECISKQTKFRQLQGTKRMNKWRADFEIYKWKYFPLLLFTISFWIVSYQFNWIRELLFATFWIPFLALNDLPFECNKKGMNISTYFHLGEMKHWPLREFIPFRNGFSSEWANEIKQPSGKTWELLLQEPRRI